MNLRQKAKRYKKLYEDILPKKPYPVVYVERGAKHYKARTFAHERELAYAEIEPQVLKSNIEIAILRELKPFIWDNLKKEEDQYTGETIYTLDVWM